MVESNKSLVRTLLAAWSAHDVGRACACIGETCNGGGPAGFRKELVTFLTAFPDVTVTLDEIVGEGDRVATRVTIRGSHQGPLLGLSATGRSVEVTASHFFRCGAGRIVRRHGQLDRFELLTQLGATMGPASVPSQG